MPLEDPNDTSPLRIDIVNGHDSQQVNNNTPITPLNHAGTDNNDASSNDNTCPFTTHPDVRSDDDDCQTYNLHCIVRTKRAFIKATLQQCDKNWNPLVSFPSIGHEFLIDTGMDMHVYIIKYAQTVCMLR
jgi:hypothetical protein